MLFQLFVLFRISTLDVGEVKYLINTIWSFKPSKNAENAMKKLEWNKDGIMTIAEFVLLSRHFEHLLLPVRKMKMKLQKAIVHKRFWREQCEKRLDNFQLLTIFDLAERIDKDYIVCSMEYLSLQKDVVPPQFVEQWNFITRRRQNSRKGNVALPFELLDPSLQGVRQFSEKKRKSGMMSIFGSG